MDVVPSIVVTGMGVVSPVGIGLEPFWTALANGVSGISRDPRFAGHDVPWSQTARVDDFDGKRFVKPRKAIKVMCREIQFAYAAATMAVEQATGTALPEHPFDKDRLAVVFGAETFQGEPEELLSAFQACQALGSVDTRTWGKVAMSQIQPLWMLKYLPNMAASHISIALDARGPNNTICQGDVSAALALIEGADLIRRGWADAAVVGGTSSRVSPVGMAYRGVQGLSPNREDPTHALRPFDRDRDGGVHGEGAAALVLESAAHLRRRGGKPLARLLGWSRGFGNTQDPKFHQTIIRVMNDAIEMAGIDRSAWGHINAHGSGTCGGDLQEALAIREFAAEPRVAAFKANLGDAGPSSPALEIVASILATRHRQLPPACSFRCRDEDLQLNLPTAIEPLDSTRFLKLSIAPTGQIVALVFEGLE